MEPQPPPPKDGPSLPAGGCCADEAIWYLGRRLVSAQEGGLGWRAEGPPLWRPGVHPRTLHRTPATPHPAPAASPKPHGRPQYGRRSQQGPRPLAGRPGREGATARPRSLLVAPGVQRGAGGAARREWGGWGGGGPGRARERGREVNKRSLCGAAARRGAHYPMPRSHVGNKRTILCLAWKTTWSRERPGES